MRRYCVYAPWVFVERNEGGVSASFGRRSHPSHPRWTSVRRCTFCMTRAEKLFPVLCTVLSVEASTYVVDTDYRPDSRATNLKSEGHVDRGR